MLVEENIILDGGNLSSDNHQTIDTMFNAGISEKQIATVITDTFNKAGIKGKFLTTTIRNIGKKSQNAINAIT